MVSHMACQQRCTHFQEIAALVRGLARDNDGLHNPLNKAGSFLGGGWRYPSIPMKTRHFVDFGRPSTIPCAVLARAKREPDSHFLGTFSVFC